MSNYDEKKTAMLQEYGEDTGYQETIVKELHQLLRLMLALLSHTFKNFRLLMSLFLLPSLTPNAGVQQPLPQN